MTNLAKTKIKNKKRVGRGYGSGRGGHTAGRGTKGQKSRSKIGILFEGVKVRKSLYKRLPLRRGKGKFKAKSKPLIIDISLLNIFPDKSKVNLQTLNKYQIVKTKDSYNGVKILGKSGLTKKLEIHIPISKSSAKIVEKAGGKIIK